MNLLVTGANGYVGSSLVSGLKNTHNVTALNRQTLDLSDSETVNKYFSDKYFDVVLHCASTGGSRLKTDSSEVLDNNLSMYYNLLSNQDKFGKFINFGSGAELTDKESYYGLSKRIINSSILGRDNFYTVRIFAVFDENELESRFLKTNIRKYINKEPMNIFSNKIMDFFYMGDLIRLIQYYITHDDMPKEFECSYEDHPSLVSLADIINTLHYYKVAISCKSQGSAHYYGSYQELPVDFVGVQEGILRTYKSLKNQHYNKT